jgi:hypothetical protein
MTDEEMLKAAHKFLVSHTDAGPIDEGWQSDELVELLEAIEKRLDRTEQ